MKVVTIRDSKDGTVRHQKLAEQADFDWYRALWESLVAGKMVLDFTTFDGRVFQISGHPQFTGCFERYLAQEQPTRRNIHQGGDEIVVALAEAEKFHIYQGMADEGKEFSFEELKDTVGTTLFGKKRYWEE